MDLHRLVTHSKLLVAVEGAASAGLFESLAEGAMTTRELADRLPAQQEPLKALLTVLAEGGVLDRHGDRWLVADGLDRALTPGAPSSLLPLLELEAWAAADHLNAAGVVAALQGRRHPTEIPPDLVATLAEAMTVGARLPALRIARRAELASAKHVADVAGGPAAYAIAITRHHRHLRVTVLDRPAMLTHARRAIEAAGAGDRVEASRWDLHADPLPPGIDAALVSHTLHLLDLDGRRALFQRIADRLPPGAPLLIHDFLSERPPLTAPALATMVDWLALGSAFRPLADDLRHELEAEAFELVEVVPLLPGDTALAVARRR
jgi:ubiquinone/menaquinone biosynthesis C-methylase UbiE